MTIVPPRWAVLYQPQVLTFGTGDLANISAALFREVGPVGCFIGEGPIDPTLVIEHPRVGELRLKDAQFGLLQSSMSAEQVKEITDATGWIATGKTRWWVFDRPVGDAVITSWIVAGVTLARLHGREASLDPRRGWRATLHSRLDELRGTHRASEVSRALVGTISSLLEFGAIHLAEERLLAFRQAGGAEAVALPYEIEIAWSKNDWEAVSRIAEGLHGALNPSVTWRVAWADLELGRPEVAASRFERHTDLPPARSRTGAWYRLSFAAVEAQRHRLENAVRLLADTPTDAPLAQARRRVGDLVEAAVTSLAREGVENVTSRLGRVSTWASKDLPTEVRPTLSAYLVSSTGSAQVVTPTTAFDQWAQRFESAGDSADLRREAFALLAGEIGGTRSPTRISRLILAIVRDDVAWRPAPELLELFRSIQPGTLSLSPNAQAAIARALLLAGDGAHALRWAQQASHALLDLDPGSCQAIAEALSPDFENAEARARDAWIRVLAEPPPWTTRPRLAGSGDIVRRQVAVAIAEQLYANSDYSRAITMLLHELEPLARWSDLWNARELALVLVDALSDAGDRERAFDVAAQLWPVALAAGDAPFIEDELITRFEDPRRLGPLDAGTWQVLFEGIAPFVSGTGFATLRDWLTGRSHALLARAKWGPSDPDFDPAELIRSLEQHLISVPAELHPSTSDTSTVPVIADSADRPASVLIVGGYSDVQRRATTALLGLGVKVKTLDPGFNENVDEKQVREALVGVERVIVVWRCILHRVSLTLDQVLSRPAYAGVERVFARGKGHTSIIAAALRAG